MPHSGRTPGRWHATSASTWTSSAASPTSSGTSSAPRTDDAAHRLWHQHAGGRGTEVPHDSAARYWSDVELRAGCRRPDGHDHEAASRVADLRRRPVFAADLAGCQTLAGVRVE